MDYVIKHFDTPLLRFSADPLSVDPQYRITWVSDEHRNLLPHGLDLTPQGLDSWVRHRTIPKNRAFANNFLAANGLSSNRALGTLALSKGLSLNDCYWVVEESDRAAFEDKNLYDNPISQLLASVAFTGYGSGPKNGFSSSPEFTTNGMLPKCWRRINGGIYLYKGGTSGFANSGNEPYSEFYAAEIADAAGFSHIAYSLHKWKGLLCSSCELFTSKELSYVSAANFVRSGGFPAVVEFYMGLGEEYVQALSDMLAFDAIICNTDRHMNNYGFLVDSKTNQIAAPAPLFDHGNSLFYQAYGNNWDSDRDLEEYANTQYPCLYDDFFATARQYMTHETASKVRKLLEFSFERSSRYHLPRKRRDMIQTQVQLRAKRLLESGSD